MNKHHVLSVCAAFAAAVSYAAGVTLVDEDFSVIDEKGHSPSIDIESNTSYSHGHARIEDGSYIIAVPGNKHFLAAPKVSDFRLEMDYDILPHYNEGELGFIVYFRWNRDTSEGDVLKVYYDAGHILNVYYGEKLILRDRGSGFMERKGRKFVLAVEGRKAIADIGAVRVGFDLEPREAGYVGLDTTFSTSLRVPIHRVRLSTTDELQKTRVFDSVFELEQVQAAQEAIRYDVSIDRYRTGGYVVSYRLSGTVAQHKDPLHTGGEEGGEWGRITERLTDPYLRIDAADGELRYHPIFNGTRDLVDPNAVRGVETTNPGWPAEGSFYLRTLPARFSVAAGYRHFVGTPWRFAENGPYEQIRDEKGELVHEGPSVRGDSIALKALPWPDNELSKMIPTDIPRREEALNHARKGGFFMEGEKVRFTFERLWRADRWEKSEIPSVPEFTTVFGDPLADNRAIVRETADEFLSGGIRRVTSDVTLEKPLASGVYRFGETFFEVIARDPDAVPAPVASGLPFLISMPNETKFIEENGFDPYNTFFGYTHLYATDNQYPIVGHALQVWKTLPLYRRGWFCQSWPRNADNIDMYNEWNRNLIRNSRYFGCYDNRHNNQSRFEFGVMSFYVDDQLKILRDFVAEKKPPLKRLTLAKLNDLVKKNAPIDFEDLRDIFNTCWEPLLAYARPRIDALTTEFNEYLWSLNPRVGRMTYGPYAVYVTRYKTAYTLRYSGYPIETDPRIRANGSAWILEEYHHSCGYPIWRPALFLASYDLYYRNGRKIYPEIYTSSWGRCNDGAVNQAHPFGMGRHMPDTHLRRVVYRYVYGTPQFRDGAYRYWDDCGFQFRDPEKGEFDEFLYAWGKVVKNRPSKSAKAPFIMLDIDQIALHGDYFDDQYNTCFWGYEFGDICNSAEEGLAYLYEKTCEAGYTTPVLSTLDELDAITPEMADYVALPPIVKGTPKNHLDAIRRAHKRGVNLLCSESCVGLEDIFGVEVDPDGPRKVGCIRGEVFEHKLALASYRAKGAEVSLSGSGAFGEKADIPVIFRSRTGRSRAVFVNIPMATVRKNSMRVNYHWGTDSVSVEMKKAITSEMAYLSDAPSVKAERGGAIASETESGDLVVVLTEDSPDFSDPTVYPATFRFVVRAKGVGSRKIESDAAFTVVSRREDEIVLRTQTDKDTAHFFRFSPK